MNIAKRFVETYDIFRFGKFEIYIRIMYLYLYFNYFN